MNLFNLDKKVALITGGNGGIGYAMAKAIGDAGANIIIAGRNVDKNTLSVNRLKNSHALISLQAFRVHSVVLATNLLICSRKFNWFEIFQ